MRVVHLNTHELAGGATKAMIRLHDGLLEHGVQSTVFYRSGPGSLSRSQTLKAPSLMERFRRRVRWHRIRRELSPYRSMLGRELFSTDRSVYGRAIVTEIPPHDVVHLHWIAGFLDYGTFFRRLPRTSPIVWTLHDMNPFSGGCHQDDSCGRFSKSCGRCPKLRSQDEDDLSRRVVIRKQRAFAAVEPAKLHLVAPSRWLAGRAGRSSLMSRFEISVIPNGVDSDLFHPMDRRQARAILGVDPSSRYILFVSTNRLNPRKGFRYLKRTLPLLDDRRKASLLCVGPSSRPPEIDFPCVDLGEISDDRAMAAAYCAADVMVAPFIDDNFPNSILESLACGTPVVGHDSGGIPEMLEDGQTGAVVDCTEPAHCAAALEDTMESSESLAHGCRARALSQYSVTLQTSRYLALYEEILSGKSAGRR